MEDRIYRRLARHLDTLPGGYPATDSGVELRILYRLFSPEEAELAIHLLLIPEPARAIARRAGLSEDVAEARLADMARKGLIYRIRKDDRPLYQALQFVIGIWEFHVNDLDEELIREVNAYLPHLIVPEDWKQAPQLRTIPIRQDIPVAHDILPHEAAQDLVRGRRRIAVAPCICRREHTMTGNGCDRPLETCLIFGQAADYYTENGLGRTITDEEALHILAEADRSGLVLQPSNSRRITNICCCCGCCCQVLKSFKRYPRPAELASSPFEVSAEADLCIECGHCIDRCQMDALSLAEEGISVDPDRCIGCGLCIGSCETGALTLGRRPPERQRKVPSTQAVAYLRLARQRGVLGAADVTTMALRSAKDRILSR